MNNRLNKKIVVMMICILTLFMTACGLNNKNANINNTKKENAIYIYYPGEDEVVCDSEVYQLKQPDSLVSSIEEIMTILAPKINQDSITYHTYMLSEDNDVELEFVQNNDVDSHYLLLVKAAVTSTLFQLKDINCIQVSINDSIGEIVYEEQFGRDSFFFYDSTVEDLLNRDIDLYCKSEDGAVLNKTMVSINLDSYTRIEEQIISLLAETGSIPMGTTVENATIDSGVCYLELSKGFSDAVEGTKNEVVVYSVVNSIIAATKVDLVKIIVNGETDAMYRGTVDLSEPLGFNGEIVQ